MQMAVPEVMDISKEPAHILEMYGAKPGEESFANNCLLARRLSQQGVRFIQLFDWGWDSHGADKNAMRSTRLLKTSAANRSPRWRRS